MEMKLLVRYVTFNMAPGTKLMNLRLDFVVNIQYRLRMLNAKWHVSGLVKRRKHLRI